jgi:hypothetical protein
MRLGFVALRVEPNYCWIVNVVGPWKQAGVLGVPSGRESRLCSESGTNPQVVVDAVLSRCILPRRNEAEIPRTCTDGGKYGG